MFPVHTHFPILVGLLLHPYDYPPPLEEEEKEEEKEEEEEEETNKGPICVAHILNGS